MRQEKNGQHYAMRREAESKLAPGPGQYKPVLEVQQKRMNTACCFKSTTNRFKNGVIAAKV